MMNDDVKDQFLGQHTPGAKLDHDKIDMSLLQLLPRAMEEVCRVMDYGQTKYSRGGFLEVPNAIVRYTAALMRHIFQEPFHKYDMGDPFYDTEKGLPFKGKIRTDAQVAVNALFRLECRLREEEMMRDERPLHEREIVLPPLKHIYTDNDGVDHEL